MLTKDRVTRIAELMTRRDEIATELEQLGKLAEERTKVNEELSQLILDEGAPPPPASGRKCGNCGKPGHSAKTCPEPKK